MNDMRKLINLVEGAKTGLSDKTIDSYREKSDKAVGDHARKTGDNTFTLDRKTGNRIDGLRRAADRKPVEEVQKKPRPTPHEVDYYDDEFKKRRGTKHETNGNLSWVEDNETGEGSWRAPFEVDEQADADDMYDDSSVLDTFGRRDGQEFTDRGRGNVRPRQGMDARFADNPMGDEQLDEFSGGASEPIGFTAKPDQIEKLHMYLTRAGMSDTAIRQSSDDSFLTDEGKQKVAGVLGISVEDVDLLTRTLVANLRKEDDDSTNAVLDDYYTMMGEGADVPMVIRTIPEGHTWKDQDPEDKENVRKNDKNKKAQRELKGKQKELDERKFVEPEDLEDKKSAKERDAEKRKARDKKEKRQKAELEEAKNKTWMKAGAPSPKKGGDVKGKRPFKDGVMRERISYEKDALGNVTIRDQESGKERFIQGTQATKLLAQLASGADPNVLLAPLMESNAEDSTSDYMAEIEAPAGTYNFEWEIDNEHGTGTAMYRTDTSKPVLKLVSVRDDVGDEIDNYDSHMYQELLDQARDFIGNE